jgi:hypothetical protein
MTHVCFPLHPTSLVQMVQMVQMVRDYFSKNNFLPVPKMSRTICTNLYHPSHSPPASSCIGDQRELAAGVEFFERGELALGLSFHVDNPNAKEGD